MGVAVGGEGVAEARVGGVAAAVGAAVAFVGPPPAAALGLRCLTLPQLKSKVGRYIWWYYRCVCERERERDSNDTTMFP